MATIKARQSGKSEAVCGGQSRIKLSRTRAGLGQCAPSSVEASISPLALPRRFWMASSFSVPLPLSLDSRTSIEGGLMKINLPGMPAALTRRAPCTSMSKMQSLPPLITFSTAAFEVP